MTLFDKTLEVLGIEIDKDSPKYKEMVELFNGSIQLSHVEYALWMDTQTIRAGQDEWTYRGDNFKKKHTSDEMFAIYLGEAIKTSDSISEYEKFMDEYDKLHHCCPKCGSIDYDTTLIGYPLIQGKEEKYKDMNKCTCTGCELIHVRHDRVSIETYYGNN